MEHTNFDEDICFNNTYLLITGKKTIEEFLDSDADLWFLHNPEDQPLRHNNPIYEELLSYFIYTEEYEKCQEIVNLQTKLKQIIYN
jgi:hypothetical protein|tara:strand:- start:647 stop:904 length:258 start_codon:yes stop_codon:yes gene_type:complete